MNIHVTSDLINFANAAVSREGLSVPEVLGLGYYETSLNPCYNTKETYECPSSAQEAILECARVTGLSRASIIGATKFTYGTVGKFKFNKNEWDWAHYIDDLDECQKFFLSSSWGLYQIRTRLVIQDLTIRGTPLDICQWIPACIEFYRSPTAQMEYIIRQLKLTGQKTVIQRFNYYINRQKNPANADGKLITVLPEATDAAQMVFQIKELLSGGTERRTEETAR